MKYIIIFVITFFTHRLLANECDSFDFYLNKLDKQSVRLINIGYISTIEIAPEINSLVKMKCENKLERSIQNLKDSEKTVAILYVLAQMDNIHDLHIQQFIFGDDVLAFYGLLWYPDSYGCVKYVEDSQVKLIKRFWKLKTKSKESTLRIVFKYIDEVDWSSFHLDRKNSKLILGSKMRTMLSLSEYISRDSLSSKLVEELGNSSRTIAVHILLTNILDLEKTEAVKAAKAYWKGKG